MFACLYLAGATSVAPLVALAQDFSPRFEIVSTSAVLVDATGLDRLVGDADAVGAAMARLARARGLAVTPALAPTRTAAMLLALTAASPSSGTAALVYRLVRPGDVASALAPLPLSLLTALHGLEHDASPALATPASRRARGSRTRGSARHYRLAPGPDTVAPSAPPPTPRTRGENAIPAKAQRPTGDPQLLDLLQTLHRWGLQTLGALAALPSVELFERLGTAGLAWQAVARGEDRRPLVCTALDEPFETTAALEWPVDTLEPLSFVVSGLLEPLCARLTRAERGAAELQTTLQLVNRTLHVRRLELPAPMRDVKVLRTLVLLDLESHPPEAGIDRVTITIAPTSERIVQHSLLARARPSPEQVATLTARLMAVLGDSRVGAPALVDSYAPGAFTLRPFDGDVVKAGSGGTSVVDAVSRPLTGFVLRRFRDRVPVRVERTRGRPVRISVSSAALRGGRVVQAAGPWRTSGAWWELDGKPADVMRAPGSREPGAGSREPGAGSREPAISPWDRDEWDIVVADGTALRLSRDRESGAWFVDGVLD